MLVIAAALGLLENLVNGIRDAWHTAEMPFLRNHFREVVVVIKNLTPLDFLLSPWMQMRSGTRKYRFRRH